MYQGRYYYSNWLLRRLMMRIRSAAQLKNKKIIEYTCIIKTTCPKFHLSHSNNITDGGLMCISARVMAQEKNAFPESGRISVEFICLSRLCFLQCFVTVLVSFFSNVPKTSIPLASHGTVHAPKPYEDYLCFLAKLVTLIYAYDNHSD